jgi:hypothetical protein
LSFILQCRPLTYQVAVDDFGKRLGKYGCNNTSTKGIEMLMRCRAKNIKETSYDYTGPGIPTNQEAKANRDTNNNKAQV